jgi:N-acetyl-alpha-D-glucosaminyl L-malate synthase BshA
MRIGITCHSGSGGSGILATELGLRMAARGHEVHFIVRESPFRLPGYVENVFLHPVEDVYYPLFQAPPHTMALASKMAEVAVTYDLDVLHVHYAIPHAVSAYLAKQMLAPRAIGVVTTLHGTDITLVGNQPIFQRITRFCIEASDRVTAVSRFLEQETRRIFGIQRDIRVIHNFVDCERFRPRATPELRRRFAAPDELILMHASNFRPVKNVGVLLEVFAAVTRERAARLVLLGEGPELPFAQRRASELGLGDRVVYLGNQEAIEELLPLADVFLLPSHHESFGLAALEAMACGVAVICTSVGGATAVIEEGKDGFLRHPADVSGWVEATLGLLRDPERRRRVGDAARRTAKQRFCSDEAAARYEEEYVRARDVARDRAAVR